MMFLKIVIARSKTTKQSHRMAVLHFLSTSRWMFLFIMTVAAIVLVPRFVSAQACPPAFVSCGGVCVAPASNQGSPCSASGGRVGLIDECGACTNLSCPGGQTFCSGACQPTAAACPSGVNRSYDPCTGCGGCASGFSDCDAGAGYNCQAVTSASCPSPRIYDPCTGSCTDAYVRISPASTQPGFFNVAGNGTLGGDLYLNSGKAIWVESSGATSLQMGHALGGDFRLNLLGNLVMGTGFIFPSGAPSGSFITAGNVYTNAIYSRLLASSPDNLWIGDNNDIVQVKGGIIVGGNMGIGVASPLSKLDVAGDVRWTGTLQGGSVPWARLTNFPSACSTGEYISAIDSGGLTCRPSAGGSLSGTVNKLAKFTGATILRDSILTETSGTISVGGSITATGCFGPVYVGSTASAYNGSQGGYRGVKNLCNSAISGSHVCTTDEIINSIHCNATIPASGAYWVIEGPPGYTAPANDCVGWTNGASGSYGTYWDFGQGLGGVGWMTICSNTLQFACCK